MEFIVKENENHQLESIVNKNDKYKMNWVATGKKWGEMFLPDGITGRIERTVSTKGKITEKYIFVNNHRLYGRFSILFCVINCKHFVIFV